MKSGAASFAMFFRYNLFVSYILIASWKLHFDLIYGHISLYFAFIRKDPLIINILLKTLQSEF